MCLLMPDISAVDCSMFSKELDGGSSTSNSGGRKHVGFVTVRNCMATGIVAFRELSFIADVCFRIVLEKSSFY